MHPAIFLDRDGVIIENVDTYVRSWTDVAIFPNALSALSRLRASQYKVVMITNQSVVGRGIIPLQAAQEINDRLVEIIADAGGRIDGVYLCPHSPADHCSCRKPKPGLILQAAAALSIDLSQSVLIGDALTDLQAGQNAGIPTNILVRTGRGAAQAALHAASSGLPLTVYDTLHDAIDALLTGLLPGYSQPVQKS